MLDAERVAEASGLDYIKARRVAPALRCTSLESDAFMIVYDLTCNKGHVFEAWFKDSAAYDKQEKKKQLTCAVCGSSKVRKALMAPRLAGTRDDSPADGEQQAASYANDPKVAKAIELMKELAKLRRHVEDNADYVGDKFAEEARKIHYGEKERRNIYGEATSSEAEELSEEGVEFARIPWVPRHDS
jgi:hypothetical protein